MPETESNNAPRFPLLIKAADQVTLAVVLTVVLGVIAGYWFYYGGHRGGLIEIDRAEPLSVDFQVDINRADWPELTLLPGISETYARRIVDLRERDGPFLDHDDLQRIKGIGPKVMERVRPYLLPIPDRDSVAGP